MSQVDYRKGDVIKERHKSDIDCPLCNGRAFHYTVTDELFGKTYYWSCPDCPFIGVEFYRTEDLLNVANSL